MSDYIRGYIEGLADSAAQAKAMAKHMRERGADGSEPFGAWQRSADLIAEALTMLSDACQNRADNARAVMEDARALGLADEPK